MCGDGIGQSHGRLTAPGLTCPLTISTISPRSNQLQNIPDDIITDPTLQREAIECPKCLHVGAVFFMAKVSTSDERLKLIYVCTNTACIHKWQD